MSHAPWAMCHESWTHDNRLVNSSIIHYRFRYTQNQELRCRFLGFKDSPNFHFMFSGIYWSHIQDLKNLLDGLSGFFGARLFENWQHFGFPKLWYLKVIFLKKVPLFFLDCFGILVSPIIKIVGFGAQGHVPKSRNHRHYEFWFLP